MDSDTLIRGLNNFEPRAIARAISLVEDGDPRSDRILASLDEGRIEEALVVGITGPPGGGKSTLTDRMIGRYRAAGRRVGVVAVDPSSSISGGAFLGDRVRMMDHALDPGVIVRSMAARGRLGGLCASAGAVVRIMASVGCSPIIIETVGVGQAEMDVIRLADITALVLAPGLGDDIQAMKAGLLEVVDVLVVNKADCAGAETLAMDMEAVARERSRSGRPTARVCTTVASDGRGIDELLEAVSAIDAEHRRAGERGKRRARAYDLEVLDWALELLRPRLLEKIEARAGDRRGDPRLRAIRIIEEYGAESGSGKPV